MDRFRFSLESLLNLEKQRRDECLSKLSSINGRVLELQQSLESLGAEQETLRNYLGVQSGNSIVDVGLVSRCHMHLTQLETQQYRVASEFEDARKEREGQRRKLVEAEQKVKTLEKLKEKQFDEYRLRLEMRSRQEQEDNLSARLLRDLHS